MLCKIKLTFEVIVLSLNQSVKVLENNNLGLTDCTYISAVEDAETDTFCLWEVLKLVKSTFPYQSAGQILNQSVKGANSDVCGIKSKLPKHTPLGFFTPSLEILTDPWPTLLYGLQHTPVIQN